MIMEVMSDSAQYLVLCSYRPVAQEVRESRFFVRVVASHQIPRTGKSIKHSDSPSRCYRIANRTSMRMHLILISCNRIIRRSKGFPFGRSFKIVVVAMVIAGAHSETNGHNILSTVEMVTL
jgi:hypothetical protein